MVTGECHTLFGCQRFKSLSVDERISFAKQNKLCFNCLSRNHQSSSYSLTRRCTVNDCGKCHTKFLHTINRETPVKQQAQSINRVTQVPTVSNVTTVTSELTGAGVSVNALPIAIVPLILRNLITLAEVQTNALLDSGSTNSFCSSEIVQQLGLHGIAENLNLTLNTEQRVVDTALVSLELCSVDKTVVMEISEVFVVEKVLMNVSNKVKLEDVKAWPHLIDIQLPEADSSKVGFLIGQSCPDAMVPLEIRRGEVGTPYAVRTVFGWTVNGPVRMFPAGLRTASVGLNFVQSSSVLECQTERLWMLDKYQTQHLHLCLSMTERNLTYGMIRCDSVMVIMNCHPF